jgi:hypothetical protein
MLIGAKIYLNRGLGYNLDLLLSSNENLWCAYSHAQLSKNQWHACKTEIEGIFKFSNNNSNRSKMNISNHKSNYATQWLLTLTNKWFHQERAVPLGHRGRLIQLIALEEKKQPILNQMNEQKESLIQ